MDAKRFLYTTAVTSKKLIILLIALCVSTSNAHSESIWKVTSKKSGTVYLVGDPRALLTTDYPLASVYEEAFKASAVVVTEYDFIKLSLDQKHAISSKSRESMDRSNTPLRKRIRPEDWDRLIKTLKALDIGRVEMIRLKPAMIARRLSTEKLRAKGYTSPGLAEYFYTKASATQKLTETLERTDDFSYFFASRNKASDTTIIQSALDDMDNFDAQMEQKRAAWHTGDLELIHQMYVNPVQTRMPNVSRVLFQERVERWMPNITRQLDSYQTVMIIVGLEHIPGEHGIIAKLENMGYQIENITSI